MILKPLNIFIFLSVSLLVACGGSESTAPNSSSNTSNNQDVQTASENPESDVTKSITLENSSHLIASIKTENNGQQLVWGTDNQLDAQYTVYIANDINIDEDNFALLDAKVIQNAQSPVPLQNLSGGTQYVKIIATIDRETVANSDTLPLNASHIDVNQTGQQLVKLDSEGHTLDDTAAEWDCVLDQTTGLVWQVNNDNPEARYAWNQDGRPASQESQGLCGLYSPGQCGTEALVTRTNTQSLCGINTWRLPNIAELRGLADFSKSLPAINTDFFPNTQNGHYWAAEAFAKNTDYAWNVSFDYGHAVTSPTSANMADVGYVRLVAQR